MDWSELDFWKSEEWKSIQEKLDYLDKKGVEYNPGRDNIFKALDVVPYDKVRVMIIGQDPYPNPKDATGIAFHTGTDNIPSTLGNIFKEYVSDLKYPIPNTGDLSKWIEQGVLLWNAIPTCIAWKSLSHIDWPWSYLTAEIIDKLAQERRVVFVFMGGVAREYAQYADHFVSHIIETSHPSPRASINSNKPFKGSRIFSTINDHINQLRKERIEDKLDPLVSPIDWRLR